MISLNVKLRAAKGRGANELRRQDIIPAVVYGPGEKNASIEVSAKEFKKVFKTAGESSLIELSVDGEKSKRLVLVHELQKDPVSDEFIHIDFFQPSLTHEVQVPIPLVFEGVSFAVKDLGANLVKNMSEIEVKALPQNLPHEIRVSIESLKNIGDHILIKDLNLPQGVSVLKKPDEIVALAAAPEKVEEELEKPVEEDVSKVEKIEKEKKAEEIIEEPAPASEKK
jgi:large subunit ribosomal protein L25